MAAIDLGRIRLVHTGAFDASKDYVFLDAVTYQGSSYMCNVKDGIPAGNIPGESALWTLIAQKGDQGIAATIEVGTVTTLAAGSEATVTNVGSAEEAVFNFAIPQGAKGEKGDKGDPFEIFRTYTTVAEMEADAANVPDGKFLMIAGDVEEVDTGKLYVKAGDTFDFITDLSGAQGIKGEAATVAVGNIRTVGASEQANVTNSGSEHNAVFDFDIPRGTTFTPAVSEDGVISWSNDGGLENPAEIDITGPEGKAATIAVNPVVEVLEAGATGSVVNEGDANAAVFKFSLPQGVKGDKGDAATVEVLPTVTGAAGTQASVENKGDTSAAKFEFTVPKGATFTPAISAEGDVSWTNDANLVNPTTVNVRGATYTPAVASNGDLSWTNDKGLANPATVNIQGPKGDEGQSILSAEVDDNGHLKITYGFLSEQA